MAVSESEHSADERIARLYRDAAREEPAGHLDNAIRRAARAAGSPSARGPRWWASWRLPLALAAVGIVSVSLVTLMLEEGGGRLTDTARSPAAAPPEASPPAGATPPDARPSPAQQRARGDSPAPGPAPDSEARRAKARAQERTEASELESAGAKRRRAIEQPSAQAPHPSGAATAGDPGEPRKAAPAVTEPSSPAPPAIPGGGAAPERSRRPAATPAPAQQAAPPRREAPHDSGAAEIARLEEKPPEVWLERISRLRSEGREREADALLIEFRARFPEAAVPLPAR